MAELTQGQQQALEQMHEWMRSRDQVALLTGKGGTGKGFLCGYFLQNYRGIFCLTATTNKALNVAIEQLDEFGVTPDDSRTIYSLLGLKLSPDGEVKELRKSRESTLSDFSLIIVDEVSMAPPVLVEHLSNELSSSPNTKVLLIGDRNQLRPVNTDDPISPAFKLASRVFELTEIVRAHKDNPLVTYCNKLRDCIDAAQAGKSYTLPVAENARDENGNGIFVLPRPTFSEWIKSGFATDEYANDSNAFKIIAWRNARVDKYNQFVRKHIYGEKAQRQFVEGEPIILTEPVIRDDEILAHTDATGRIMSLRETTHPERVVNFFGDFKVWELDVMMKSGEPLTLHVLHEDSVADYHRQLDQLAQVARENKREWGTFWSFKEAFNSVKYSHAITSHRSQGSSYGTVFVDRGDILANPNSGEALQALYVACSRAKKNLILPQV